MLYELDLVGVSTVIERIVVTRCFRSYLAKEQMHGRDCLFCGQQLSVLRRKLVVTFTTNTCS